MKHQPILFVAGIASLILGLIIRYSVGRRRFNRRTPFGLQQFRSYNQALATRGGGGVRPRYRHSPYSGWLGSDLCWAGLGPFAMPEAVCPELGLI